ncbi:Tripartite tricarboxylate transporter TctB family protein [Enhydrobacter aerosaccus]|uniref:Tripartite tricarboxylate transporter TctB family protein n=1 Tax=Enhydrobacter aerosaccus TaxID=225324 RepID=A0A1T4TNJ9_9HYPH|nr:tripartite tricarboxylate transporter TctB family protein [Enhydrobacter aerosaccus]SKA36567.1 Tripartite tricarboxylate transporter TctB family protein [Enhydrobacter aerosaccus]SKA41769.1 Tripartite tricarboxylate transporter TctB family protein [Enhydrobacter aerosaccus]
MSRFLSKDFLSGVMFVAFGLATLWFGRNLQPGTTVRMGPGYVPHMLAYIMLVLGLIISAVALYTGGEIVERPKWKPITMVTIGIVAFALLFESTGMLPALVALIFIASLGGDEFKLTEVIANMVVLTILCIIVFKLGLGMNISVIEGIW